MKKIILILVILVIVSIALIWLHIPNRFPGSNLIKNGNFQEILVGWKTCEDLTVSTGTTMIEAELDRPEGKITENKKFTFLRLSSKGCFYQKVRVPKDGTYFFQFRYMTSCITGDKCEPNPVCVKLGVGPCRDEIRSYAFYDTQWKRATDYIVLKKGHVYICVDGENSYFTGFSLRDVNEM